MGYKRLFNHSISLFLHGFFLRAAYFTQVNGLTSLESILLSLGIVWLIMSMVLFFFKIQCHVPYPEGIKRLREFENPGLYNLFGIKAYKWLLLRSPFKLLNGGVYLHEMRGKKALSKLLLKMEEAEWAHFINFFLVMISLPLYAHLAPYLLFWNVIFNVYPILLQRYHRLRIVKLI